MQIQLSCKVLWKLIYYGKRYVNSVKWFAQNSKGYVKAKSNMIMMPLTCSSLHRVWQSIVQTMTLLLPIIRENEHLSKKNIKVLHTFT